LLLFSAGVSARMFVPNLKRSYFETEQFYKSIVQKIFNRLSVAAISVDFIDICQFAGTIQHQWQMRRKKLMAHFVGDEATRALTKPEF